VAPGASSVPGTAGDAARRVARAALTVDGVLPDVAGAAVLRLLTEPNVAVGAVPWGLGPALSAMLPGVTCIDVTPADDPAAVVDRVAGRTVVAAVRDAHRHRRVLDLLAALASRTDLVTVELGWPGGRLPGVAVVRTLGASAVSAQVAAELLASRGVAP
jgi:beta-N-acetylhexosaminidase